MPAFDQALADRIAAFKVRVQGTVEGLRSGLHRSPHRGASVVFAEHRDYRPGDDTRLLDWRAYARNDRFTIKHYEQETHLSAHLALDVSSSMAYGQGHAEKLGYGATLLSALGVVLLRQGDTAAALRMADGQLDRLPGRSHLDHVSALLSFLGEANPNAKGTDLEQSLLSVGEIAGKRGLVAVASDLLDPSPTALRALPLLRAQGHEVWVFHVLHPDELQLPFQETTRFVDAESDRAMEVDPRAIRELYQAQLAEFLNRTQDTCIASGCRYVLARTDQPVHQTLAAAITRGESRPWG